MDDFFPYVTYSDEYPDDQENWTGFYTSRPAFKYMIREGSNLLQVLTHFYARLLLLFVTDDYIRILYRGFEECLKIQNSFYQYLHY